MNGFSASEAALEGFRLTRERVGTILAWSGVYFLGMMVIAILMMVTLGPQVIALARKGLMNSQDLEAVSEMLSKSGPAFLLVLVLVVALMSVLMGGIYRLVLRPDEPGLAHLRLGRDELRLTVVNLILFSLGMVCLVFGFLVVAFAERSGPLAGFLVGAAVVCGSMYLGVRLSMVTPMTFAGRKISFVDAWRMTHGRFWSLFGMIVLAVIFYVMVWLLITIIGIAIVALAGGQQGLADVNHLSVGAVVATIATVIMQLVLSVLQVVMIYAPFAVTYQQLHGDQPANPLRIHTKASSSES